MPFSHFCEKARWALDRGGLGYTEDRHLPMLHWAATLRAGGGRTVPVLVTDDGVFPDSTDILKYVDARAPGVSPLYPHDARSRAECEALEDEFDERLGPDVRRVGYSFAFSDREIILALARRAGAPGWQFETMRLTLPFVRTVMLRAMRVDERGVERSLSRIRATFDRVAERLRDGRRYLVTDRFSAADLTFAALAGPLVQPREHPVAFPSERFPAELQRLEAEMRAHPAGAFVLRLYAEHRLPSTRSTSGT